MTMSRTVCFLTGTLNALAGAERMTATIANALAQRGHTVRILSLWDAERCYELHSGVQHDTLYVKRPSFRTHYLGAIRRIRHYLLQHNIDTLVEVDTMLLLFTAPACAGLGIRRVSWEHCNFDQDLGRYARRWARRLAARTSWRVVVLTDLDRDKWIVRTGARNVVVIPNALPFAIPEKPACRTSRTAIAVGRLTAAKGYDVLLDAWARVAQVFPRWTLCIVGDGELCHTLQERRDALGLHDAVRFEPARRDIEAVYRNASLFCLSSRYEGFGLVLIEAMAHGLPIVSTGCETGPQALLTHGVNAHVVAVDDAAALASAIIAVISEDALAKRLAAAGRITAARFEISCVADRWEQLLFT
jgi:glycosyltransferase involved in cell wall biosynthesis